MRPRTSTRRDSRVGGGGGPWSGILTPGRVLAGILTILVLVFIFQNTQQTEIQVLVTEVTTPLWLALVITTVVGFIIGAFSLGRRR